MDSTSVVGQDVTAFVADLSGHAMHELPPADESGADWLSVRAFGQRLCEPCIHLQRLTRPGVVAGLVHQGGLRADILTDGEIPLGGEIRDA